MNLTNKDRSLVISCLKSLILDAKSDVITQHDPYGICWHLQRKLERKCKDLDFYGYEIVEKYSQSWTGFSGNKTFPIPANNFLYLWVGRSLNLRIDLMEHIISELKEEIVRENISIAINNPSKSLITKQRMFILFLSFVVGLYFFI